VTKYNPLKLLSIPKYAQVRLVLDAVVFSQRKSLLSAINVFLRKLLILLCPKKSCDGNSARSVAWPSKTCKMTYVVNARL